MVAIQTNLLMARDLAGQTLYVSGPMRGLKKFNFPSFDGVTRVLRTAGVNVFNPADHDREVNPGCESLPGFEEGDLAEYVKHTASFEKLLAWDLEVISRDCDGLVMLPGWEKSTGAKIERFAAESMGLTIYITDGMAAIPWFWVDPEQKRLSLTFDLLTQTPWGETAKVSGYTPPNSNGSAQEATQPLSAEVEIRVVNEKTGGAKGQKLERFDLIPVHPLTELAKLYGVGANKYAERNWELGYDWNLSYAAALRHLTQFWNGENLDPETGAPHPINVVFHMFAMTEFMRTHPELDTRP